MPCPSQTSGFNVPNYVRRICRTSIFANGLRTAAADHSFIRQPLSGAYVVSDSFNIRCKMPVGTQTWSNVEVCSVIQFSRLKDTSPAKVHRQLIEVYGLRCKCHVTGTARRGDSGERC
ncbi:hypothetical protein ANN_24492 [Periplaneta americana]|uniref:Uncharacterized protein n=1 Tax=Periplaneta americana TaxID=6978 RepID=A0ABQ8S3G2_PERAM|nr:hypothetical protein ANN_24492 [Periplaneta americana]